MFVNGKKKMTESRGAIDMENVRNVVGEEEAIWVLKLLLPYLNEFLLKVRALFCGDPATTMKVCFFRAWLHSI